MIPLWRPLLPWKAPYIQREPTQHVPFYVSLHYATVWFSVLCVDVCDKHSLYSHPSANRAVGCCCCWLFWHSVTFMLQCFPTFVSLLIQRQHAFGTPRGMVFSCLPTTDNSHPHPTMCFFFRSSNSMLLYTAAVAVVATHRCVPNGSILQFLLWQGIIAVWSFPCTDEADALCVGWTTWAVEVVGLSEQHRNCLLSSGPSHARIRFGWTLPVDIDRCDFVSLELAALCVWYKNKCHFHAIHVWLIILTIMNLIIVMIITIKISVLRMMILITMKLIKTTSCFTFFDSMIQYNQYPLLVLVKGA